MFEMSEEQTALFNALTTLKQRVALNKISGMSPSNSHREAGGKCKNEANRHKLASEILINPDVVKFINSMANHIVNPAVMSRQEMIERLSGLARTNMSDLITWGLQGDTVANETNEDGDELDPEDMPENQEGQSVWVIKPSALQDPNKVASIAEVSAGKDGIKIKQHSPLAAMKQLAELAGYEAPKQIEVSSKDELTPWGAITAASDE